MKRYTGLVAFALSCVVCLGGVGVFADVDVSGNDIPIQDVSGNSVVEEKVENYIEDNGEQVINASSTEQSSVSLSIQPSFSITIPKSITLDSETKSGEYTVSVNGDIDGATTISVLPEDTITMYQYGKDNITATVTQGKTEWRSADMGTESIGTISCSDASAGTWDGVLNFQIDVSQDIVLNMYDKDGNVVFQDTYSKGTDVSISSLVDKLPNTIDGLELRGFNTVLGSSDITYTVSDVVYVDRVVNLYPVYSM